MARDGQSLFMSLADPFHETAEEILVQQVTEAELTTFVTQYKRHFGETVKQRFGFFRPEVDKVLTEYPDWQTFYGSWLQNDSVLLQANMPLLFDYPSAGEYRAVQLKDADYAGYRRLLVVIYQYRKQQFQRMFIKQVDDAGWANLQAQIIGLYERSLPHIIFPEGAVREPS